ncbi:hypothetical protein [Nannocystis radixulma]|uniref:Uncharacterized protein n=1 Tax=Nannocystis radixulma TaxID=2995305 RepID=A0ABT5BMJ2_9BACT|nr:hypothetical protein [Nannocystis radixulma]MDC0675384.1 hypothetical protein [Nannocystis radixulma]
MRTRMYAFALGGSLAGCSLDEPRIWASVLANAPFIYAAGLLVLSSLYQPWSRAVPGLKFGRRSHWATFAGLVALMVWAWPRAQFDGIGAYWLFFGSATGALWLLLWRIAMIWPKSQPFRWTGAVAFAVSTSPAIAGLASPAFAAYGSAGILAWLWGSMVGLTFVLVLVAVGLEAWRVGLRADRARAASEQGATPARPDP